MTGPSVGTDPLTSDVSASAARSALWAKRAARTAYAAVAFAVFVAFFQFHLPGRGFTYMLDFGGTIGLPRLQEVDAVGAYVHAAAPGYDGQMYAQLALRPAADDPELQRVIDNPAYRARRAMMGWVAWALGGGDPWRVLNAFALINLVTWFGLAALLLRWFPPTGAGNFVRWSGVMLSAGVLSSMRHALTDAPALLALAGSVVLLTSGRRWTGVAAGAVAVLTRETSLLLGAVLLPQSWRDVRGWIRGALQGIVMLLPFALWLWRLRGLAKADAYASGGFANFTWPFAGFLERWVFLASSLVERGLQLTLAAAILLHLALTVQMLWILVRPRWNDPWWRIGAAHVALLALLNTQVWEGFPGAAARVLLPLTLAFNILAPRGRRGLLLLILGNLTFFAGRLELRPPPHDIWRVTGPAVEAGAENAGRSVSVVFGDGFFSSEGQGSNTWRWTSGDANLRIENAGTVTWQARLRLEVRTRSVRAVQLRVADEPVWRGIGSPEHQEVETDTFAIPPGGVDMKVVMGPGDPPLVGETRTFGLRIFDLDVVIEGGRSPGGS